MNTWYHLSNIATIDSPALVVYPDRALHNIRLLKQLVGDPANIRPHVKTNKIAEVCQLMLDEGITQFKCATIAEAEMLALIGAPDVLLAYQPIGPKAIRFLQLMKSYPATVFSCLVDNAGSLEALSELSTGDMRVFIDLNTGMDRSGIRPGEGALDLWNRGLQLPGITMVGLHAYDGHVSDTDIATRQQRSNAGFETVEKLAGAIGTDPVIVVGGSPSLPTHRRRTGVQCSPGTFVFWDHSYKTTLPDLPFDYAALVISRVVSIIDEHTICTDLGHKSVAAENPFPRVFFLNAPEATPIRQSEEHLVLKVPDASKYSVGDVFYGAPVHICPTVALYERAVVVEDGRATKEWAVIARNRRINI
ncbi:D-TA family PLP-dependent enzyme [Chitinophaga horti]|uniref:D-TA family PLP-dependent enzyme n=1 Tax=Chitinophaga horti TaxID=2920382 RepID=A0ABY6JA81_9BACT|nr:D-TA family PLP-dependent enzyme [Chitinophaga horti]UYQ95467.1 D-TA family PLP-dependent enzyme [Chitinophaga horti]